MRSCLVINKYTHACVYTLLEISTVRRLLTSLDVKVVWSIDFDHEIVFSRHSTSKLRGLSISTVRRLLTSLDVEVAWYVYFDCETSSHVEITQEITEKRNFHHAAIFLRDFFSNLS